MLLAKLHPVSGILRVWDSPDAVYGDPYQWVAMLKWLTTSATAQLLCRDVGMTAPQQVAVNAECQRLGLERLIHVNPMNEAQRWQVLDTRAPTPLTTTKSRAGFELNCGWIGVYDGSECIWDISIWRLTAHKYEIGGYTKKAEKGVWHAVASELKQWGIMHALMVTNAAGAWKERWFNVERFAGRPPLSSL